MLTIYLPADEYGRLKIDADTSDITVASGFAFGSIDLCTTTGDVEGSLASGMTFITKVTTGKVNVPQASAGGTCRITATTEDITIKITPVPAE